MAAKRKEGTLFQPLFPNPNKASCKVHFIGCEKSAGLEWGLSECTQSTQIAQGNVGLNEFGAFGFILKLTENMNLGESILTIDLYRNKDSTSPMSTHKHTFEVQVIFFIPNKWI